MYFKIISLFRDLLPEISSVPRDWRVVTVTLPNSWPSELWVFPLAKIYLDCQCAQ